MFLKFKIKLRDFLPAPVSPLFPQRLPKQIEERNERLKEEMLGKFASLISLDHKYLGSVGPRDSSIFFQGKHNSLQRLLGLPFVVGGSSVGLVSS